jgi:hypothetical protein
MGEVPVILFMIALAVFVVLNWLLTFMLCKHLSNLEYKVQKLWNLAFAKTLMDAEEDHYQLGQPEKKTWENPKDAQVTPPETPEGKEKRNVPQV